MTDRELLETVLLYVQAVEEMTKQYAQRVEVLEDLLKSKAVIASDELEAALREFQAHIAVEEALDPRFQVLARLRAWLDKQGGQPPTEQNAPAAADTARGPGQRADAVRASRARREGEGPMAKIIKRTWTSPGPTGRKARHVAYGYTCMVANKRERKFSSEWQTEDDALRALAARKQEIDAGRIDRPADATLGALAEAYLAHKANEGKRSLRNDKAILKKRLLPAFGPTLPVRNLTETAIARYEQQRMAEVSAYTVSNELSILRHMLRLGRRWGYAARVPDIEMPKKPEGRIRYLEEAEIEKLLKACAESRNPYLSTIVGLALNTGMRKEEVLGLGWERVNLTADFGLEF